MSRSVAISPKNVVLPRGVEVTEKKTAIVFEKNKKKAVLKRRALEVTNPTKALGKRLKVYSEEQRERCHLGSIRGVILGVKDTVDFQKVIDRYFG